MSEFSDRAFAVLGALLPPTEADDPKVVRRWRVILALVVVMNTVSLATHIALACGFLLPMFPGFASASDVKALQRMILEQRVTSVRTQIMDTKKSACAAPSGEVRQLYTTNLTQLLSDYERLTYETEGRARRFPLPDCDAF